MHAHATIISELQNNMVKLQGIYFSILLYKFICCVHVIIGTTHNCYNNYQVPVMNVK